MTAPTVATLMLSHLAGVPEHATLRVPALSLPLVARGLPEKLRARPDAIIKMMGEAADHLPQAAVSFYTVASAKPTARPALVKALSKIEQEADSRHLKLVRKVASTFVTPYERDDLYQMLEKLDDTIDALEHAGKLIVEFEMKALPDQYVKNAQELVGMSEAARDAVNLIKKPNKMERALFRINEHENALDEGYRKVLTDALTTGSDPIEAIKLKTLADSVEDAASLIEDFVRTLSITALKEN